MKEDTIRQITSACPWVSRDQILRRLEKEKRRTGGLISDGILLRIIAAEFGCESAKTEVVVPSLMIRDLIPGLSEIAVIGRVLATFPPKSFVGARRGKFASLLIADKSGLLRVVLWNDKTSLLESRAVNVGQIVSFSHAYTRADPSGKVELHLGERSEVEKIPESTKKGNYPDISRFSPRINVLGAGYRNKRVNLVGTVRRVFPASTFARQDSTQGKVMRFVLEDPTGEIAVVVWNEKADELEKTLKTGDKLQVVNAKVKKSIGEGFEINVDGATYVGPLMQIDEPTDIAELTNGMKQVNVEGEVATKPVLRDVKTAKGEQLKLATFEIKDETGRIWVAAWRNYAEIAKNFKPGDRINIKNAHVKKGFADQLEISTGSATTIDAVP